MSPRDSRKEVQVRSGQVRSGQVKPVPQRSGSSEGQEGRFSGDRFSAFHGGEAIVSSSGTGRVNHSLTLPSQHLLCHPRRRPPSKVPRRVSSGRASVVRKGFSWCLDFLDSVAQAGES